MVYKPRVDYSKISDTEIVSVVTTGYGSAVEVFNFAAEKPTVTSYLMDVEGNRKSDATVTAMAEFTGKDQMTRMADAYAVLKRNGGDPFNLQKQLAGMKR